MRALLLILFCAALVPLPAQRQPLDKVPDSAKNSVAGRYIGRPEAIEAGRELYLSVCSGCHGVTGEGGRGPNLIAGRYVRQASDEELFSSVKNGVPGSDMPPSPLPDEQIWPLAAFVRNLAAPAYRQRVEGSPKAGAGIYYGKGGCAECHMIRGRGGFLGPDLTNVGMSLNLSRLREALLEPNKRFSQGFAPVEVVARDGRKTAGVAKNNSNYSIQLLDRGGRLFLLDKRDLAQVVFLEESWMPGDYAERLSEEEIRDLLAFLSRQAIRVPEPDKPAE